MDATLPELLGVCRAAGGLPHNPNVGIGWKWKYRRRMLLAAAFMPPMGSEMEFPAVQRTAA